MNMKPIRYIKENFGKIPFCNEKPDTAPQLGKFCFPVCWRCFALITSILITYLVAHDISTVDIICYDMPDCY